MYNILTQARPHLGSCFKAVPAVHRSAGRARSATSMAAAMDPPDVPQLAKMAQIAVTAQEIADWEPKIRSIVDWFGQLQQVNVSGVQPALSGAQQDGGSMLREDAPQAYAARAELLAQAPQLEGSFIRVPTTAGAAMADGEAAAAVAKAAAGTASASSTPAAAAPAADAAGSDKAAGDAPAPAGPDMEALHALDMRVGTIIKVEPHPDADTLYVEQVDCGEAEPRTIVSGLRKFVAAEALLGSSVIVLANLKPRNMRGIKSAGMLLCASSAAHDVVEPLAPPQGSAPGSRCYFGDSGEAQPAPAEPNRVDKKKYWDKVAPGLKTDGSGVATYCGMVMKVQAGPVKAATLKDARIA